MEKENQAIMEKKEIDNNAKNKEIYNNGKKGNR